MHVIRNRLVPAGGGAAAAAFCCPRHAQRTTHAHTDAGTSERKCIPKEKRKKKTRLGQGSPPVAPPPRLLVPSLRRDSCDSGESKKREEVWRIWLGDSVWFLTHICMWHFPAAGQDVCPIRRSARRICTAIAAWCVWVNVTSMSRKIEAPPVWYLYAHEPHSILRRH